GALSSLSGIPVTMGVSLPIIYYGASDGTGLDGQGRITKVTASSGTSPIVNNVTYSPNTTATALPGSLTGVTFSSADSDSFSYDPKTGRQTGYVFSVNGVTDAGSLTWSKNGTLSTFAISDNLSGSTDSQTCNYFYDDLGRLGGKSPMGYSVDCGAAWQQLFSFDSFGNIQKSGTGSFLPTYSASTNRFTIS